VWAIVRVDLRELLRMFLSEHATHLVYGFAAVAAREE
jgi:hypothetical protein